MQERVLRFLASPAGAEPFAELALAVFAFQYERNAAYRRWCEALDCDPCQVRQLEDIPAVPTAAFKELEFCCGPPVTVFSTSGTTGAGTGRHLMPSLEPYRAAALTQFARYVMPEGGKMRILVLAPPPALRPASSLSRMLAWVLDAFGAQGSGWYVSASGLESDPLLQALLVARRDKVPVLLAGTTAAFLAFFNHCEAAGTCLQLLAGSRLMDTGGQKGSGEPEPRPLAEFQAWVYRRAQLTLGIPEERCVNEYGMTELSSQFYDPVLVMRQGLGGRAGAPGTRCKVGPPWVRTSVRDPVTLKPCPPGELGLLQHLDLANVGSVMAVLTEDVGRMAGAGFQLEGRPRTAEARGCGLTFAELMGVAR